MILLLLGCVDQLYPGRTWACGGWPTVSLEAPGPLQLSDAGPDDRCRVAAYGERFPRPIDGFFFDADDVEVIGTDTLEASWSPGDGATLLQLTDRVGPDEPLLDLVQIRASGEGSGNVTWKRGDGSVDARHLYVSCDRCTVRARVLGSVELTQTDSASVATLCDVDTLELTEPVLGVVQVYNVTSFVYDTLLPPSGLVTLNQRPDACSR